VPAPPSREVENVPDRPQHHVPQQQVPQPSPTRLTAFSGSPVVVGIVPDQPDLVVLTALSLSEAMGRAPLFLAYVDTERYTVEELADGSVRHAQLDPDVVDDSWRETDARIRRHLAETLDGRGVDWEFRYLAGSPQRSLTHLARAVDAAAIVVGTHAPGAETRLHEFFEGSVAVQLTHHQHRPVLVVPLSVVDWKESGTWR